MSELELYGSTLLSLVFQIIVWKLVRSLAEYGRLVPVIDAPEAVDVDPVLDPGRVGELYDRGAGSMLVL